MNNNTLCPIPWNHIGIQQNGDLRQCCQMIANPNGKFFNDDGTAIKFDIETIDAVQNHHSIKKIRKEMMAGEKPDACNLCWSEEENGIDSKRKSMLQTYPMEKMLEATSSDGTINIDQHRLEYLDLRLGNLCNLKCRSCSPTDSSLWVEDYAELTQINGKAKLNYYNSKHYDIIKTNKGWQIDSNDFNWHENPRFHSWLDTKIQNGLDRIYFTGGEPTVNKQHFKILDRIIEMSAANNITLEYNTNMVAIPPSLLEKWKKFKAISIGASVDATGKLASYIRHPGRWSDVEKNCDMIGYSQIPHLHGGIATTVSILNIRHFLDLTKWLINKRYTNFNIFPSWHLLHGPDYLNIQTLPVSIKEEIANEYESFYIWIASNHSDQMSQDIKKYYSGIISFMFKTDLSHKLPKLAVVLRKLDELRGESLEEQLPWLNDIIKNI
jgi:MoaA/NifB/PqqE/SkfB family radical SAM enzyme